MAYFAKLGLAKFPFHLDDAWAPFVGIGPTVVPVFADESSVHFGGVVAAGVSYGLGDWGSIFAELNYNLIYEHGAVHEIGVNTGIGFKL